SPVLEPEKSKEMLAPTQGNSSTSKYFEDPTLSTEIQKYKAGELKQGSELVRDFYQKLERLRKLSAQARCDKDSEHREKLFRGLSPTNQDEVKSWGMYLPLDELIERLETLEQLSE
ncbi:3622_t:CDS:2, partial [Funneliformis geosporum]